MCKPVVFNEHVGVATMCKERVDKVDMWLGVVRKCYWWGFVGLTEHQLHSFLVFLAVYLQRVYFFCTF